MNIMLFHSLWICWCSTGEWRRGGVGYSWDTVKEKWVVSIWWTKIWYIQIMWLYNNRPHDMPLIYSLRKAKQ